MLKAQTVEKSLALLTQRMQKSDRVFFTRFGDGDLFQITGTDSQNRPLGTRSIGGNRTVFSKELQADLKKAILIQDKDYLIALSVYWETEPGMIDGLFKSFPYKRELDKKARQFVTSDKILIPVLFHYLITFAPEVFDMFIETFIKGHNIVFVGSNKKSAVEKVLGKVHTYIKTPEQNAFSDIEKFYPKIEKAIKNGCDVVIPTCGQASRAINGRLWMSGARVHSIDMGSLFDAVQGKPSRTWIKLKGKEIYNRYNK